MGHTQRKINDDSEVMKEKENGDEWKIVEEKEEKRFHAHRETEKAKNIKQYEVWPLQRAEVLRDSTNL